MIIMLTRYEVFSHLISSLKGSNYVAFILQYKIRSKSKLSHYTPYGR
jgi:hypothetical protein